MADRVLSEQLNHTLAETHLDSLGERYRGKVRDVYRQRDRTKMFSLLFKSLRRQRQLARRFDEMRRIYRDALPVLSSKQKWETALLPAAGPAANQERQDG